MEMLLAEALLRRKELQSKVDQFKHIDPRALVARVNERVNINDTTDSIVASVPKIKASELTSMHDFYARQLRRVDAAIQQANWTTNIEVNDDVNQDFVERE